MHHLDPRQRIRLPFLILMLVAACFPTSASADFPRAVLNALQPTGGRQGSQVTVTLLGVDLDDLQSLSFSHPGITATPALTEASEFDPQPRAIPRTMVVTIAPDVPAGLYDVVAVGRYGVSNPRSFVVGTTVEVAKEGEPDSPAKAQNVAIESTVTARATGGKSDHYAVSLKAGQRIRAEVWAQRIDSRMTPVVEVLDTDGTVIATARRHHDDDPFVDFTAPIEGRYLLRIHDLYAGGGDDNHYRLTLSAAPQIDFIFPPVTRLGDSLKLDLFGVGLPGGVPANLPGGSTRDNAASLETITVEARAGDPAIPATTRTGRRLLAPRDAAAELVDLVADVSGIEQPLPPVVPSPSLAVAESEPNDKPATSQSVTFPATLAGRFYPRGDRDWFTFEAKTGDTIVFDLISNRLGIQTDPCLTIESISATADGKPAVKEIAFVDDGPAEFIGGAVDRPSADPTLEFKAPADGTYRLLVRDLKADSRTSPENAWVLVARNPVPDFRLLVLLAEQNRVDATKAHSVPPVIDGGGSLTLDVLVFRADGFTGDVTIEAEGLPPGVTAAPVGPPSASRFSLVLSAAEGTTPWSGSIRVVGRAKIGDADVIRTARVATLRFNADHADLPRILREVNALPLAVTVDAAPLTVAPTETKTWETARGGKVSIPLSVVHRPGAKGDVSLTATGLPAELKLPEIKIAESATAATAEIDLDPKLPAGTYQILLRGSTKMAYARNPQAAELAKSDHERIAALGKDRAAQFETAKTALAAADKVIADLQTTGQPPTVEQVEARTKAEALVKETEAKAKAAEEERVRREKAAADAAAAAAPKDIDVPVVVPSIMLRVAEVPLEVGGPPEQVTLKGAATAVLPVPLERRYGLTGEVILEAAPANPVPGLSVAAVTVPADQAQGGLMIVSTGDTPPGRYELILKGKAKFHDRDVVAERKVAVVVEAP
jgi:hypothetical protein